MYAGRDVSEEEQNDPSKYFYGKYNKDLVYTGMNVDFVLDFLAKNKRKP